MRILKIFYSLFIVYALIFSSCSSSETNETTTESLTEEQVDTITSADEEPVKIDEENVDDKPVENKTGNQDKAKKKTAQKTAEEPSKNQDQVKTETIKKSEPVKTTNYNFIIANEGKQVADDFKGDLMTSAAEEVYIEKKGKCGFEDCGKKIILVNMNQNKMIKTTVQINWKENDKKNSKKRSYILKESQKLEIGCSSKCDENNTTIKWQIIGALYSD